MYVPNNIIDAVKETKADMAEVKPKNSEPKFKKLPNRVLQAISSGLRTSTSIANALSVPKQRVQSSLWNLKNRGLIQATKQKGKTEYKYHLDTGEPVLGATKKKARKPYTKRKSTYNKAGVSTTNSFNTKPKDEVLTAEQAKAIVQMNQDLDRMMQRISNLEVTLTEKEKEVWTLECEVFDKKAIIKYLEDKLFQLGVRV